MKRITIFLLAAACIITAVSCSKSGGGWVDLKPSTDLKGWTIIPMPPDAPLSEKPQWSATREGALRCDGSGGHDWIRYDAREFSDFVFHVEWKFDSKEEPAKYNSGVFVRNSEDGRVWHQAQMGSQSGGFLFGNTLIGGEIKRVNTRDQMKPEKNPVKAAGEWNTFDITCKNDRISLAVNGVETTVWEKCEVLKGYVGLEAEGFAVEFRNMRIMEL